jgi:hypothetical protein
MKNALTISPAEVQMPSKAKRPASDTVNRGETNRISIEFTENGFSVVTSFDPEKIDPKLERWNQMPDDEKMSFNDCEAAEAYICGLMKEHMDYEASEGKGEKKPAAGKKVVK